jgi:hypothetical protein
VTAQQESIAWALLILTPALQQTANNGGATVLGKASADKLLDVLDFVARQQARIEKAARAGGRKPLGERAMTGTERARKSRAAGKGRKPSPPRQE